MTINEKKKFGSNLALRRTASKVLENLVQKTYWLLTKPEVKMAAHWQVFFFARLYMDLDSVLVHKHIKKELDQYPAILTEQSWSLEDLLQLWPSWNFFLHDTG